MAPGFTLRLSGYLMGGGPLMPLIGLVSFLIWLCYLVGYVRLKRLRRDEGTPLAGEELALTLEALRLLVVVAPLLGLLGTVLGMTGTFSALASGAEEMGTRLADGIHVALYTTQAGLMAALPGVFALAHLQHLLHETRGGKSTGGPAR